MSEMQNKILGAIAKVATDHGVESVKKEKWANQGAVYIQPVDGFDTVLTIFYDFQDSYFSLHLVGDVVEKVMDEKPVLVKAPLGYSPPGVMSGNPSPVDAKNGSALHFPGRYDNGTDITYVLDVIGRLIDKSKESS